MNRLLPRLMVALLVSATAACATTTAPPRDPAASRAIPSYTIPPQIPTEAYERFIVIGDMGTGREDQRKVAVAMVSKAGADGLDFMLTVGDNFYEDGVKSVDDPQWRSKFEDIYADASLDVPIYPTLGNHDHRGSIQAQIDYSKKSGRWTMPAAYFTFTRTLGDDTKVQFFAVDTTPIHLGEDVANQLAWLDVELEKSKAHWKIVFGHHPLFSNSIHGDSPKMIAKLEPLFVKHRVDLFLAGHDHTLEMFKPIKGVHYVVTGAGGGADKAYPIKWTDESHYAATLGGFTYFRVSRNELVIEFVRLDGKTQYAYTITK